MKLSKVICLLLLAFTFGHTSVTAQDSAIGHWQSMLPYKSARGIATDGNTIYTVTDQAFFTWKNNPGELETYSKVEGMSDVGMQCVGYDMATSTAVLVYSNGNIDLYKNNTFYNIPDLLLKNVSGEKAVYNIFTENGFAYLSTTLGVVVIDIAKQSIRETYQFIYQSGSDNEIIPVRSFNRVQNYFYALTEKGVYRADKNSAQLQNYQVWQQLDTIDRFTNMAVVNDTLFFSTPQSVYVFLGDSARVVYTSATAVHHIDAGHNNLYISEYFPSVVRIMDHGYNIIDTFSCPFYPVQVIQLLNNSIWVADSATGLVQRTGTNEVGAFGPASPNDANSFDIYAHNKSVFIAHGGYDSKFFAAHSNSGVSIYQNDKWIIYRQYLYNPFDTLRDFVAVLRDEKDGTLYAGSFLDGLFILKKDGSYRLVKQNVFDLSSSNGGIDGRQVIGLGLDSYHNLWVSEYSSQHQLYVKTPDDLWYKFAVPGASGGQLLVDDRDQAWFVCADAGGVAVYNANGTPADPSDDGSYHFSTGAGFGNLPSNKVYCIAKDKKNEIWVGTDNGIGIISNCYASGAPCNDARAPIVQYDKYAGYLFAGSAVRSIAVDGANRKWVGTDDGVWLLSESADKIILRFTKDNSPMPSDHIQKIAIDDVTGDVYIGTDMGLISYRSTGTEGGAANSNVLVFPNPVPATYKGTIAIKGLVANADVRITDIDGQLVYKTKALGGQAVWDGKDYNGRKPQTGVYLVFVTNEDGTQATTTKIVFLQ